MKSLLVILSNPRYFGPAWVFASLNILFGTWAIYIPTVKENLGIDKASLGIAIFCLALGSFTSFPVASKIINKIGVGKATSVGVVLIAVSGILPLLAPNLYGLMLGLYLMGATHGFTDISMNTLVTEIEKEDKQHFMSAAHGFFSLGGVLAGLGSFLIPVIGNPLIHMVLAIALVLLVNLFFYKKYRNVVAAPIEKEPFNFSLFKPLLVIGIISFVIMGSEGAIVDWSGLYLQEISRAPEVLIGTGFLAFSVTMTLGRFMGDSISARMGSIPLVAVGIFLAIVGYILVLTTYTYLAILGFGFIGLGFSAIIPELFRLGGTIKGVESSKGVSFIAGTGYSGFLLGPVVLGFIAESASLKLSFIALLGCAILVLLATLTLHRKR
ncbi:MFS transporter [Arenibacter sp. GZD96]|uniref:MFS transporter n=1 Tax=Aurantibrevibacter litoralis TaxID=3106030 RepID=UPI002AFFC5C2|nr:MFS transporter [Arenibacter sp. GZD-96]MEA1786687.1 MFS transporter [Arenibacter sp. GZD-96]